MIVEVRNELHNPRGEEGPLDGWAFGTTGGTASGEYVVDDELGGCVEVSITAPPGGALVSVEVGNDADSGYVRIKPEQVIYQRTVLRVDEGAVEVSQAFEWFDGFAVALGSSTGSHTRFLTATPTAGQDAGATMEGFALSSELPISNTRRDRSLAKHLVGFLAGEGDHTIRLYCQIHANPPGDVPAYCDGDEPDCEWEGTPNASTSSGTARTAIEQKFGFQLYTPLLWPDAEVDESEALELALQCGARVLRTRANYDPLTNGTFAATGDDVPAPQTVQGGAIDWHVGPWADYFDQIRRRHLGLILVVGGPMPWMTGAPYPGLVDSALFPELAEVYAAAVEEWADIIVAVEVYNEPNLEYFWGATPSASKYVEMAEAFYPAMKEVAPDIPVLNGGLAHRTGGSSGLSTYLTALYANGLKDVTDGISIHPYPAGAFTGHIPGGGEWDDGFWRTVRNTRTVMRTNGDHEKAVWATEFNLSLGDDQSHGAKYRQGQTVALCRGILARHPWTQGAQVVHELVRRNATEDNWYGAVRMPSTVFSPAAAEMAA